jgi:lipopolysaccharide transport system ATP-binding protein
VATAARPEILIVDETLSVGDAYFAHKCIQRIKAFREAGTTILLVSHDPTAVRTLCGRALLLDEGRLIQDGPADLVLDYYNALIATREANREILQAEATPGRVTTRSGSFQARVADVELLDGTGQPGRAFTVQDQARVSVVVEFAAPVVAPTVGILIRDRLGNDVFGTNTFYAAPIEGTYGPGEVLRADVDVPLNLGPGAYTLTVALHSGATHVSENYDWWDKVIGFEIVRGPEPYFVGSTWLPVRFRVEAVRETARSRAGRPRASAGHTDPTRTAPPA